MRAFIRPAYLPLFGHPVTQQKPDRPTRGQLVGGRHVPSIRLGSRDLDIRVVLLRID